jgi:hypothetical protein
MKLKVKELLDFFDNKKDDKRHDIVITGRQ